MYENALSFLYYKNAHFACTLTLLRTSADVESVAYSWTRTHPAPRSGWVMGFAQIRVFFLGGTWRT